MHPLTSEPSAALPPELADAFRRAGGRLGRVAARVVFFPSTGSTNDVATSLVASGVGEGTVVIADAQTSGRGRRGRTWFSPAFSGLYVSLILEPGGGRGLLTLAAGVALAEGIQQLTGLGPEIKWPNDLLSGERKCAGILAEAVSDRHVVLGYGINVGGVSFPPELATRATSLEIELGRPVDRAELCVETLAAFERRYADLLAGRFDAILDAWRDRAPGSRGRRVAWQTVAGTRSGITAGIDNDGALLVTTGDSVERLVAGEVVWV